MNDHRPSAIQVIASSFIQKILGPRFKSQLTSKNDSARYPYSQHRRRMKSEAVGATGTAGINHDDEGSARNSYKPSMSQPFLNLDGVEPFISDKYGQDASRPVSYRTSGISDGEASTPCASASPDGLAQRSLTMTASAPADAVRSHADAPLPKIIGHAKNSDFSDGGGSRAVGQDDNATTYMPGVETLSAPSGELGVDEEDDVPLIVLKEQAHRHLHAEQRPGPSINKSMATEHMSPEVVITGSDGAQSVHEWVENEADMALPSDAATTISLQHSHRKEPLGPSDIGAASSLTSLQTFTTGSASPGPSFGYIPTSSPFPSSRPSPKIIVPSTASRRSSRRISMDRNGNLSSLRFSPTIVSRHPPLPLKLPTLPTLTPPQTNNQNTDEQQKLDRRARYRSMPALPRGGGHEEEDDGDEDEGDTIDEEGEDDILQSEEGGRALSRIDESDARSSSSAGSDSSVRSFSRTSSYATAPSEAKQQPRQEHIQESHHRGYLGAFLPQVDTSRLDLSFLDKPPTPLLETKRKGKARETDAATPTERLQREYFSSALGGTAGASSSTLVSNKRASMYQTKTLSSIQGRSSIMPLHTPKPGFAALKTLPLPPLADAERPGMYKHASQSMINVSLKPNEEKPPLLVNVGEPEMNKDSGGLIEPADGKGKEKSLSRVSLAEAPPLPKFLRRRSSMPSYSGLSSPPPPYPTFAPFPRPTVIQPREDEGVEKLPPYVNSIYLKSILPRKMEFSKPGVQAKDRKWRRVICVLEGTMFRVYQCPASVAGVSAIEGWWERRVGVGDVSSSASTHTSATTLIHGPSIRSAQGSEPRRQNENKEEQRNQPSATVTITSKMEPKRSRLAVPFLKSVRTHIRSRSDGSQEMRQGPTRTPGGSLSSRAPSPGSEVASSQSSAWSGNGTQGAVSRSSTREEVPDPDPADLIKTYSLQRAECGLGLDYVKRKNVIRVKMDGEQFLVQAKEPMEVVAWIEGIQTGTNVALDLDERAMPRGPLFPRWVVFWIVSWADRQLDGGDGDE